MDEEFKKKAAEAFKTGADAAKKIGGIACDLGKRGFAAAREKVREFDEKARLEREKQEERVHEAAWRYAEKGDRVQGDPQDKCFLMSYGWLYFIWWFINIVDSLVCLIWIGAVLESYRAKGTVWIPLVIWPVALLFNRLAYEAAIALFEMVRHLRQIRDELRRHNMREERKVRKALEKEQACEGSVKNVQQDEEEQRQTDSTVI